MRENLENPMVSLCTEGILKFREGILKIQEGISNIQKALLKDRHRGLAYGGRGMNKKKGVLKGEKGQKYKNTDTREMKDVWDSDALLPES